VGEMVTYAASTSRRLRETLMRWQSWLTLADISFLVELRASCSPSNQGFWLEKHAR
jgi:hypothetical protein